MSQTLVNTLNVALFLFWGVTLAFSQSGKGQISGLVTDPQGLLVPKATVDIVYWDTSAKREVMTDDSGHYSVIDLPGGRYQATVQAEGFAPFSSDDISLAPDQSLVFDVKLSALPFRAAAPR